jgi:hypothetical protein
MVMFSVEELGLIAYLNDNASSAMNGSLLELTSDATDRVMDRYLSRSSDGEGTDEDRALKMLNDRRIRRDAPSAPYFIGRNTKGWYLWN